MEDITFAVLSENSNEGKRFHKRRLVLAVLLGLLILGGGGFFYETRPADAGNTTSSTFEIKAGDGLRSVASHLFAAHLIRSSLALEALALAEGRAGTLRPGLYRLSPAMGESEVLAVISGGNAGETRVTIPEGSNLYEIDGILSRALVIHSGDLVRLQQSGVMGNMEGKLFPDTYEFYTNSNVRDVAREMMDTFTTKAQPLLATAGNGAAPQAKTLIIASILEKEVPGESDREVVAGIINRRLAAGMPLDIDATVCYAKLLAQNATGSAVTSCVPLASLDFKIKSPYNSYLYGGLPPGPIGNPGLAAITAALHPQSSSYWYYLSDPSTGKTIFAKTLDEQTENRVKYLVR